MAARFWVSGGTGNTNSTTNWSATSGGASGASVPVSTDDVTFDGAGNSNATVNATHTWLSLTITSGYTATMTHNAVLTIVTNWNYSNTYTIAGTSAITHTAGGTITSGQAWPNNLTITVTATKTLSGDFTINGLLTISGSGQIITINKTTAEKLILAGGLANNNNQIDGTADIKITGGTWSSVPFSPSGASISNNIELDGTITLTNVFPRSNIFKHTSGTITHTGALWLSGNTLDVSGVTFNTVTIPVTNTLTLTSDFIASGLVSVTGSGQIITINKTASETFSSGGLSLLNNRILGTVQKYLLTGGTWSATVTINTLLGSVAVPLAIAGNVTVSGTVGFQAATLEYISGTPVVTSSTLHLSAGATLNTNGMTWNNVTLTDTTGGTYTINSTFSASQITIGTGATTTFAGTAGFTVGTLSCVNVGVTTVNFKESITYTITTSFSCFSSRVGSIVLFTSSHGSTKANLLLVNPSLCNVLANFTCIDASGGRTINSFGGTITDCVNVRQFFDYQNVGVRDF